MSAWDLASPVRPSRIHQGVNAFFHVLAMAAILVAELPMGVRAGFLALILGLWILVLLRGRRHGGQQVSELAWAEAESYPVIILASGQRLRVRWQRVAVWRWLVVLDMQAVDVDWRDTLLLWPDSLQTQVFRRLRVRLLLDRDGPELPVSQR
jgi:hypothetical protein